MGNNNISLSSDAIDKIKELTSTNGTKLRISVSGGGCSGFQYKYDFVTEENLDDIILRKGGVTVLIDAISAQFMQDAVIDYVETLGSSELLINNPNAASRCGCGNSFSI